MEKDHRIQVKVLLVIAAGLIGTGTLFYHFFEGLTYIDAFYMSAVTLTTVGFGDFVPHTNLGKIFTSFYILFGVGILFQAFNLISKIRVEKHINRVENKLEKKSDKRVSKK